MVAYSYKKRFYAPIRVGLGLPIEPIPNLPIAAGVKIRPKRQTIRADRKRHARPGEELQHYCGMRTKSCFLIGRARCTRVRSIEMRFLRNGFTIDVDGVPYINAAAEEFARMDGFADSADMLAFWKAEHPGVEHFAGVVIEWEPLEKTG